MMAEYYAGDRSPNKESGSIQIKKLSTSSGPLTYWAYLLLSSLS